MQNQYNQIKSQHPDEIVLFRLGDFYEAFNSDAETISRVLGITLTGRGKDANRVPMAGIPFHALPNYLPKLIQAGYKAVVVEQTTEPKPGEIVEREVTKIYTPGTLTDENVLTPAKNNYIVAIAQGAGTRPSFGMAIADISTGKLQVAEFAKLEMVAAELQRLSPAEILLPEVSSSTKSLHTLAPSNTSVSVGQTYKFEYSNAHQVCLDQFGTNSLQGFGIGELHSAVCALGGLIDYLRHTQKAAVAHMHSVRVYQYVDYMSLDINTIRNLELVQPATGNDNRYTLFGVLDHCRTAMGKRKLFDWILHPLIIKAELTQRLDSTDYFYQNLVVTDQIRELLSQILDMERIISRIGVGGGSPRDLVSLAISLESTVNLIHLLQSQPLNNAMSDLVSKASEIGEIAELIISINQAINSDAPINIADGNVINPGYHAEIDELRNLSQGGKSVLAEIQQREISRTGISSLKVAYNRVFGYYIEVTQSHKDKVPADYIRKQTLTNAERFITEELKQWEEKVLTAEAKLYELELQIFNQVKTQVLEHSQAVLQVADIVAQLDVLANFGYIARQYDYVKPELAPNGNTHILEIKDGRHPVIERYVSEFTPNDSYFDQNQQIIILTGPNMSGKSTYIRQTALITLLAQIGSFVPARQMQFSIVDRIFTRVGASDNLSKGESTFMVEMHETANILHNSTAHSLIILDEVGRGTSTYDGVAIAWAIVEYILAEIKAKTLFATHYHELISLSEKSPLIKNYHVSVIESDTRILFQHKINPGSTSRSYGIHVAEMAGIPAGVINRAQEILSKFETASPSAAPTSPSSSKSVNKEPSRPKKIAPEQLGLI